MGQGQGLLESDGKMCGSCIHRGYDDEFFEGAGIGLQELVELEKIPRVGGDHLVFERCETTHRR